MKSMNSYILYHLTKAARISLIARVKNIKTVPNWSGLLLLIFCIKIIMCGLTPIHSVQINSNTLISFI